MAYFLLKNINVYAGWLLKASLFFTDGRIAVHYYKKYFSKR